MPGLTREERKARRRQRRAARKARRADRRAAIKNFKHALKTAQVPDTEGKSVSQIRGEIKEWWPLLEAILEFTKLLTGKKADKAIDEVLALGNRLVSGEAGDDEDQLFFKKLDEIWDKLRTVLEIVQVLDAPLRDSIEEKIDDTIDDIIDIGDAVTLRDADEDDD